MARKTNAVLRFLSSGKFENPRDDAVLNEMIRYIVMNITFISGSAFLVSFGITVFMEGNVTRALLDFSVAVLGTSSVFILRTKAPFRVVAGITISAFTALCAVLIFSYGERGFAGLWVFALPPIAIFVLGLRFGALLSALLLAATSAAVFIPGLSRYVYPLPVGARYVGVYLLVAILTIVYEQVRISKDRWVKRLSAELQIERDKIVTMQNNISAGLFLIDKDSVIQPAYSNAMEDLLLVKDLAGKRFIDLLAASFKDKDIETISAYFDMVMESTLDKDMLKDINPLQTMTYIPVNAAAEELTEKTLKCGFARVEQGENEYYILGTIEDITREAELRKQLDAEESKRQEEMRSLFEVMQVDPKVFGDFIEDMEFEFDRINEVLRGGALSNNDIMIEMYQSAHAIKSNAVILGLNNFGTKLHHLESQIKKCREQETVAFDDMLHISVELEQLMREKDRFRDTIDKIKSFGSGEMLKGDKEVFLETLTRAVEKVSVDVGKQVRLEVADFDPRALAEGPRRVMKEVLTQLVRNSVYHGIEEPGVRRECGKNETGVIKLSIAVKNGLVRITLGDDGQGLDFGKILARAKGLGLIKKPEDAEDKKYLSSLIFMPAFSTSESENMHAGRGVGLNLVRDRINGLGGTISLQSAKGKGTRFEIVLPLTTQKPAEISPK